MDILTLVESAKTTGWAVGVVPLGPSFRYDLRNMATSLNLDAVPTRSGEADISELKPVSKEGARPASLSAQVGLERQPLHTDGAHLRRVPDVVVLWSESTSTTPTLVWPNPLEAIRGVDDTGVFMVTPGKGERWLAPALEEGRLRFDPGCMTPCDAMARALDAALKAPPADAVKEVAWDAPGTVLVLRNRRVLHGRAAVADGDADRVLHRIAFYEDC